MWKSLVIAADERIIFKSEVLKLTKGNFFMSTFLGQLFLVFLLIHNLTLKNMGYNFIPKKYIYHLLIFAF